MTMDYYSPPLKLRPYGGIEMCVLLLFSLLLLLLLLLLMCFRLIPIGFHWFVKWYLTSIESQLFSLETSLMF